MRDQASMPRVSLFTSAMVLCHAVWCTEVTRAGPANDPAEAVREWVRANSQYPAIDCVWLCGQDVLNRSGELDFSFEQREEYEYRWPTAFRQEVRVVQSGEDRELRLAARFNRDWYVTPGGEQYEHYLGRDSARLIGDGWSLVSLVGLHAHNAPHLLAFWLDAQPESAWSCDAESPDSVRVDMDALRLRAELTLVPVTRGGQGSRSWQLTRLEFLSDKGSPAMWWEFDDFRPVEGTGLRVAHFRASYSVRADGGLYENPPSQLVAVRTVAWTPPADVVVSLEARPDSVGDAPWSARGRRKTWLRASAGIGALLLAVGVVAVGSVRWVRAHR